MSTEPQPKLARRVVTGVNDEGNSVIVSDAETATWVRRPTGTVVMDVWRADPLPAHVDDEPAQDDELVQAPAAGGVCVRIAVFPPDKDVDAESAAVYEAARRQATRSPGRVRRPTGVISQADQSLVVCEPAAEADHPDSVRRIVEDAEELLQRGRTALLGRPGGLGSVTSIVSWTSGRLIAR